MKKAFIVSVVVVVMIAITMLTLNSDRSPYTSKEGITELPVLAKDSLVQRGKVLIANMSTQDREAIAAYYNR